MTKPRALRVIEISAPAWSDQPVKMREPTLRAWREASRLGDDQDRTIALLGFSVLGDDGEGVGKEAFDDAPLAAFAQLAKHLPELLGEVADAGPLIPPNGSPTA